MSLKFSILVTFVVFVITFVEVINADFCPGHKVKCSESQTCCVSSLPGGYACCPYANATCCTDKEHCCPAGTDCDMEHQSCVPKSKPSQIPWTDIDDGPELDENQIQKQNCPGGRQQCPDESTCCMEVAGNYGCCPYANATCCSDKEHCCPGGMDCDLEHQGCVPKTKPSQIPWTDINDELESDENEVQNQDCPGGRQHCPDDYTCCMQAAGDFGCCPMAGAVCCDDKIHCCPKGSTCQPGFCQIG